VFDIDYTANVEGRNDNGWAACGEPAIILDHIVPHRGIPRLYWEQANWQGLCARCHGIKTASETLHRDYIARA
jgi:5-methylcytosine-specific restriction endonuclease McrA